MEQAGLNSVQLVEIKNITVRYDESGTAILLESDGAKIDISSDFPINLEIQEARNKNGKIGYSYELDFIELALDTIQIIKKSIYGFFAIFRFNDLTQKILIVPLIFDKSKQENNISASYSTKISNFVTSREDLIPFDNSGIKWILDTGYWNDDAFWVDSKIWID